MTDLPSERTTTTSVASFRELARQWLAGRPELSAFNPEDDASGRSADEVNEETIARARKFQRLLHTAGFAGISWPAEYGGRGLGAEFESAWREESSRYEAPTHIFNVGIGMCGPTIIAHGTVEQKARFLRPLLLGDEVWAQLFSEPGAGSDLASVATKGAQREDGSWAINGQKVWTSSGRIADFGLALVRTDSSVPKHEGLTTFIIDMRAPGVTVRPLRQMTGRSKFDEVFFDDVVVADSLRIGAVGAGWRCARTTLSSERGAVGRNTALRGGSFRMLLSAATKSQRTNDPVARQALVRLHTQERIMGWFSTRAQEAAASERPDTFSMLAKLGATRLNRAASRFAVELVGPASMAWDPSDETADEWALRLCAVPGLSIGGGTDEIVKNTVGELILGLPREPSVDRDVPFDQLVRNRRT